MPFAIVAGLAFALTPMTEDWRGALHTELKLLGHRNWIVIADSAYPAQTSSGIRTIVTHASQTEVLSAVFGELKKAKHVFPDVYLDKELNFVSEADAPGVAAYRNSLNKMLKGWTVDRELHEDIIKDLDTAGKTFQVLILKTDFTVPYTSVFLRLDCAYWGPTKEAKLRKAMAGK